MIACLLREHREIESRLDRFAASLEAGDQQFAHAIFLETWQLAREHYRREEGAFFAVVRPELPALAAKMERQHEEAREIAAHLENPELPEPEWLSLARRWLAITQHNIIEEERELFVLAAKRDILKL